MREATHPRVAGPLAGWKHALRYTSLGLLVSMLAPGALAFVDIDGDAVPDNIDNCTAVANPDQRDSDGDGIGNRCDVDFNNDCAVNAIDLGILRLAFFSTPATPNWNPDADVNGDDVVNVIDLGQLRQGFFQPVGPTGSQSLCTCLTPDVLDPTPDSAFGGQPVQLAGSIVALPETFADQGDDLYLARTWVSEPGTYSLRIERADATLDYCPQSPVVPYSESTLPLAGCNGTPDDIQIGLAGCYEFSLRPDDDQVPASAVRLFAAERLGRWDVPVSPSGTTVTLPNSVVLDIPPGAVASDVTLTLGDAPCALLDSIFGTTTINSHTNRCVGGFTGEPEGFTFDLPVTATVPVAPLVTDEIPLWITTPGNGESYDVIPQAEITYDGSVGTVTASFTHFSTTSTAGATSNSLSITSTGDLPSCCQETPTPLDCCCTTVKVTSGEGDAASTGCDCELLGQELEVEFPSCPGSPVQTVSESHSSANCPDDLAVSLGSSDLTLWTCETRTLEVELSGTNDDGSSCNIPLPVQVTSSDAAVASVADAGPNSVTVTAISGGSTQLTVQSLVGSQFSLAPTVEVVPIDGTWDLFTVGSEVCTDSFGTSEQDDSSSGQVVLTANECSNVTIDVPFPGVAPFDGPLTITGNPATPVSLTFEQTSPLATLACVVVNGSNGMDSDFGDPLCPMGSFCEVLSCTEQYGGSVTLGPASARQGVGLSSWDFTATVEFSDGMGDVLLVDTTNCVGNASLFLTKP